MELLETEATLFRSLGWTNPSRVRKCILQGYPWKKVEFWRNNTFFGPTFPFPWSPGLSSLTALGRQLSCRSRKIKSCPSENLVPTRFLSFRVTLEEYIFLILSTFIVHFSAFLPKSSSALCWNLESYQRKQSLFHIEKVLKLSCFVTRQKIIKTHYSAFQFFIKTS